MASTAKEDRASGLGKISVSYETKKDIWGNEDVSDSNAAIAKADNIIKEQGAFASEYAKGTLLTQEANNSEGIIASLESDALSGDYGYTFDYDEVLGDYDPTAFLAAYRGYVTSRSSNIETAQKKSNTFLTGGF